MLMNLDFVEGMPGIYLLLATQRSGNVAHEVLDVTDAAEEMAERGRQAEAQVCLLIHSVDLQGRTGLLHILLINIQVIF